LKLPLSTQGLWLPFMQARPRHVVPAAPFHVQSIVTSSPPDAALSMFDRVVVHVMPLDGALRVRFFPPACAVTVAPAIGWSVKLMSAATPNVQTAAEK